KKYGWLKGQDDVIKGMIARVKQEMFERMAADLEESSKVARNIRRLPSDERQEVLNDLRHLQSTIPNYRMVFKKYLADYVDLHDAIQKVDKAVTTVIDDAEEALRHEQKVSEVSKQGLPFLERSLARKTVITVNDIVVAYEHQYDSIQNLIRGFKSPQS